MNNPENNSLSTNPWTDVIAIGVYFAVANLLLHFVFNSDYDYFRNKLYFLTRGDHRLSPSRKTSAGNLAESQALELKL